jgi:hypothetical protein
VIRTLLTGLAIWAVVSVPAALLAGRIFKVLNR